MATPARLRVRHAQRGSDEEVMEIPALLARLAPYFEPENGGHMIDQAWQPRLVEGMVRAYLVEDRVEGFGHQSVNARSEERRVGEEWFSTCGSRWAPDH